jgi:hypothetical protein
MRRIALSVFALSATLLYLWIDVESSRAQSPEQARPAAPEAAVSRTQSSPTSDELTRLRQGEDDSQPGRGRGRAAATRGRGGRATITERPATVEIQESPTFQRAGSGGRGGIGAFGNLSLPAMDPSQDETSKELIDINLWVVTIAASPKQLSEDLVSDLISKAKNAPTTFGTRDHVVDWIDKLKVAGVLERTRQFRLSALNGQTAHVQNGVTLPQVTSSSITQFGRTNAITMIPVGTIVQALPRIDASGQLRVAITYNASDLEKSSNVVLTEPADGKNPLMADQIVSQQFQSTVRLRSGTSTLVHSDIASQLAGDSAGVRMRLVILAADVISD